MSRDWSPALFGWSPILRQDRLPELGQVIGYVDRKAWRVLEVKDIHFANWRKDDREAWRRDKEPPWETWAKRPRVALCEPARHPQPNGRDRRGLKICPWAWNTHWWPLPEPYPACVDCGLLWPCPCDDRNKAAEAAMQELERLGGVLPGCCWACSEPITDRHRSIVFEGENLLLPGGSSPMFHTAASRKAHEGTCRSQAIAYEEKWVVAEPGRPVRLVCTGTLFRHLRDSECTEGDACPGVDANHSHHAYCTTQVFDSVDGEVVEHRPSRHCGTVGCRGPKVAGLVAESSGRSRA